MSLGLLAQYVMNGAMLGMMYALVAVGFTLFFGVLDVIQFSHGDVLAAGAFVALATWTALDAAGIVHPGVQLLLVALASAAAIAALGVLIGRWLVLPLRNAPPLNVLLITLMAGTVVREAIRLFYPGGSQPKRFPALLPAGALELGGFNLRLDNVILLASGGLLIVATHLLITRTRLGLAIRAVAQDAETARTMGIDLKWIVLVTFAIGSALAAFAGVMNGLYYNEIFFGMGLLLGAIGFAAAVLGGLGNLYGAIAGGFLFAALQTVGAVALPFASAYKDVFAFAAVILLMAFRPTGLLGEKVSERV
ncbi:MAG TPA: branched-chain amino acid ABC transporter permease [Myxococcaceae bacterium]|jgi:branched-chain amino acid transport system permease protein|nr:branched-chain amino acid ABC transporter permease [Myxococcaceae bacterium]